MYMQQKYQLTVSEYNDSKNKELIHCAKIPATELKKKYIDCTIFRSILKTSSEM